MLAERLAGFEHGVGDAQQFAHTGDHGDFGDFAEVQQVFVIFADHLIAPDHLEHRHIQKCFAAVCGRLE